jgi:hypothetical protein
LAAVGPGQALPSTEVKDLGAAAEPVEAPARTGEGPAESPAALEVEGLGATQSEGDDVLRLTVVLVIEPERRRRGWRALGDKPDREILVRVEFLGHLSPDRQGGLGIVGPDVEQAGEVGEIVGHVGLQKGR